jgi:hypothetical protein
MMLVIMIAMAAIMIAVVSDDAAAQEADHRYCENKEQNSFHHEIGRVLSLVCCRDAIVPAFRR